MKNLQDRESWAKNMDRIRVLLLHVLLLYLVMYLSRKKSKTM